MKLGRAKKTVRKRTCSPGIYLILLLCVVALIVMGSDYMFAIGRALLLPSGDVDSDSNDFFDDLDRITWSDRRRAAEKNSMKYGAKEVESESKPLHFGHRGEEADRDSRDWDIDDRVRGEDSLEEEYFDDVHSRSDNDTDSSVQDDDAEHNQHKNTSVDTTPGLTYERNRNELSMYEKQYEADLEQEFGRKLNKSPRRRRGGPCELVNYGNTSKSLKEPNNSSKFATFDLKYVEREENSNGLSSWVPRFGGHQSWEERERSFHAVSQTLHCGFVQAPHSTTGFDIHFKDRQHLNTCHIAVSSCIFGKSDQLHAPRKKKVSSSSKKEVCFVLFVDQLTLDVMVKEGQIPDENGYYGLWKVVLVTNLPHSDLRRVGKIPKFLSHRLFPSARYSIWIDSKLRLQSDPLSILDYFLWRGNHEYAISNHYDRHCVWDEVQQNKRLNKFSHSLIDEQFLFYQNDGLTRYNASDPKRLLPSYVPEGSFIVRAHTPMSNLFSCLWYNEVDRFTPRDQLSFAYTFLKLVRTNPKKKFRMNMFKDCERKGITKLFRHRQDGRSTIISTN